MWSVKCFINILFPPSSTSHYRQGVETSWPGGGPRHEFGVPSFAYYKMAARTGVLDPTLCSGPSSQSTEMGGKGRGVCHIHRILGPRQQCLVSTRKKSGCTITSLSLIHNPLWMGRSPLNPSPGPASQSTEEGEKIWGRAVYAKSVSP